jgi:predicted kinase
MEWDPTLWYTYGLPASGKSTWAHSFAKTSGALVLNKDTIRTMWPKKEWNRDQEAVVLRGRNAMIEASLEGGQDVIVDDTNLNPRHPQLFQDFAKKWQTACKRVSFLHVPVDTCIARDKARTDKAPVGKAVIQEMADRWLKGKLPIVVGDERPNPKPDDTKHKKAIIVDIDGTLAINRSGRDPYQPTYQELMADEVNHSVLGVVKDFLAKTPGNCVYFLTGRSADQWGTTNTWLRERAGLRHPYSNWVLYCRKASDSRKDAIVKREIYKKFIEPWNRDILFVLDDRQQVVDMWRNELGLPCFQVWYGDF